MSAEPEKRNERTPDPAAGLTPDDLRQMVDAYETSEVEQRNAEFRDRTQRYEKVLRDAISNVSDEQLSAEAQAGNDRRLLLSFHNTHCTSEILAACRMDYRVPLTCENTPSFAFLARCDVYQSWEIPKVYHDTFY